MPQLNKTVKNDTFREYFENLPRQSICHETTKFVSVNLSEQRNDESDWDMGSDESIDIERLPCAPINCCQLIGVMLLIIIFLPAGILAAHTLCKLQDEKRRVGFVEFFEFVIYRRRILSPIPTLRSSDVNIHISGYLDNLTFKVNF